MKTRSFPALRVSRGGQLAVSICVPAYNEAHNIAKVLKALLKQKTNKILIKNIVVVSSGSTDKTDQITLEIQKTDPRIKLIRQATRQGKAVAINLFLKKFKESVVIIESADTIPDINAVEELCLPFLEHKNLGMTGGAPIPVNDKNTFTGHMVHTWWWFHRNIPRFGEIIAFRNVLPAISVTTAVDEAFIQAKLIQLGYRAMHIDTAIVRNKGPETVGDLLKQRRRIFNGHSRLYEEENIKIDNMTKSSLKLLLEYKNPTFKHSCWFLGGILLEICARALGYYDSKIKKINPFVWDTAKSTKNLDTEA